MKNYLKRIQVKGFTLVELLAVIVILAIILVIAVPKVMSVIDDAKKATLEATAKMIASQAEKQKVKNTLLGKTEEITCENVAKTNDVDYADCDISFDNNIAKVTIEGSGKFEGLHVCDGTKTESIAQIYECGFSGGSSLPEIGQEPDVYTWEEINAISKAGKADEYFDLGDTKTINMGTYGDVVMEIVAFDADEKVDGSMASITWLSKDLFAKHEMNSSNYNYGGWEASSLRSWLQNDVYNILPDEVKRSIVEVNKTYYDYDSGTISTKTCSDTVWIPSVREILGAGTSNEDRGADYSIYFADNSDRIKTYKGSDSSWWLRSAAPSGNSGFSHILYNGSLSAIKAQSTLYVAIGFCTD